MSSPSGSNLTEIFSEDELIQIFAPNSKILNDFIFIESMLDVAAEIVTLASDRKSIGSIPLIAGDAFQIYLYSLKFLLECAESIKAEKIQDIRPVNPT